MKKSKIIVPALGILLLSTAASVSGTVAWFTAVRRFEANVGNFAVVKTTADLSCQFTGLVGTNATTSTKTNDTLNIDTNAVLTDGSFDYSTKKAAYPLSASGDKFAQTTALGFSSKSTDEAVEGVNRGQTNDATPKDIYTLFTWKMTFEYDSQTSGDTGLFINFDLENPSAAFNASSNNYRTNATATVDKPTKAGFRVAFCNVENGRSVVWAPFRADTDTTELKYVSSIDGSSAAVTTDLVTGTGSGYNCITSNMTGIQSLHDIDDGVTASSVNGKSNYIGTFSGNPSSPVTQLVYNCAAWYEGADSSVVSTNELATIALRLSFEARMLA